MEEAEAMVFICALGAELALHLCCSIPGGGLCTEHLLAFSDIVLCNYQHQDDVHEIIDYASRWSFTVSTEAITVWTGNSTMLAFRTPLANLRTVLPQTHEWYTMGDG